MSKPHKNKSPALKLTKTYRLPVALEDLYRAITIYVDAGGNGLFDISPYVPRGLGTEFKRYFYDTKLFEGDILLSEKENGKYKPFIYYLLGNRIYIMNKGFSYLGNKYTPDGYSIKDLVEHGLLDLFVIPYTHKEYKNYLKKFLAKPNFRLFYLKTKRPI